MKLEFIATELTESVKEVNFRTIRSYACRGIHRMTVRQSQGLADGWEQYGLQLSGSPISFEQEFRRNAPTILEIGFGMGASLLELAARNPEVNYMGIEVHKPGIGALLAGILEQQLQNIRICHGDAVQILQNYIPNNSVAGILLLFPDPWPKYRHHKRRIVQPEFIQLVHQKLMPGGYLHLATDVKDYARYMLKVIESQHTLCPLQQIESDASIMRPSTKFEQRGVKLGHAIWDLVFIRKV